MITILIVDDQPLIRDGMASLLNLRPELEVIGTAANGHEAYEKALDFKPNIVLMDIRMPISDGVEGTRLICQHITETKVLMLTTFNDGELILKALQEGASGYLLKDMASDTIVKAIETVHAGGLVLPPESTTDILKEMQKSKSNIIVDQSKELNELTDRELDVLKELGNGYNNKEIANLLFITEGTVKNHVSNIISKLGLRDRTQVAIFSVKHGICTPSESR